MAGAQYGIIGIIGACCCEAAASWTCWAAMVCCSFPMFASILASVACICLAPAMEPFAVSPDANDVSAEATSVNPCCI